LEQVPSPSGVLVHLRAKTNRERVAAWLREQVKLQPNDTRAAGDMADGVAEDGVEPFDLVSDPDAADPVIDQAMSRPWTSRQIPPLAKWVDENKKPLDLIVEASKRPRYYSPSPTLLNKERDMLIDMLLPGAQMVRDAGHALSARAMWHLGEDRPMDAWQDLLALHRLSRLLTQGNTLVEQYVAIAMSVDARDGTLALLPHGNLTVEQAREVQRDLAALPMFNSVAQSLDEDERMLTVGTLVLASSSGIRDCLSSNDMPTDGLGIGVLDLASVDWNLVLRETNDWYDRLVDAASLPDRAARCKSVDQVDADFRQMEIGLHSASQWLVGVVSRRQRSKLVFAKMLDLFLSAVSAATDVENRANCTLGLTRLAAALAVYRAEHGAYPEKLDELAPGVLGELPVDLYNAKPFVYKRTDDGYLLYSAGENGTDDGGSHEQWEILEGRSLNDLDDAEAEKLRPKIPSDADDISIRVPRPPLTLPKRPASPSP
jgi:hypothetical protein